jgi:hypothetical protein
MKHEQSADKAAAAAQPAAAEGEPEPAGPAYAAGPDAIRRLQQAIGNQAFQRAALPGLTQRAAPAERGVLAVVRPSGGQAGPPIQRTAGTLWVDEAEGSKKYVIYAKRGGHGPYAIANLASIPPELLVQGAEIEYTNNLNKTVTVTAVGTTPIAATSNEQKMELEETPANAVIDPTFQVYDRLGLPPTEKREAKTRPWLGGTAFNVDFGKSAVTVDAASTHHQLHKEAPEPGFRGNSVTVSFTAYYENQVDNSIGELPFYLHEGNTIPAEDPSLYTGPEMYEDIPDTPPPQTLPMTANSNTFKSADFGEYKDEELNELYALGRNITSQKKYTEGKRKQDVAAQYHSERDFIVKANQVDFACC